MQQDGGNIKEDLVLSCSFDFSVSLPDVQRRTLDVAVKNSGGFLSKDKGLLGKVSEKVLDGLLHLVQIQPQPQVRRFRPT